MSLLDSLFLRRVLSNRPLSECTIGWAVELLRDGVDSDNLAILAGLSTDQGSEEVEAYFRAALHDLGIEYPSDLESRLREARALASALLSERVDALEAVARIHSVAVGPLNHPPMLQPWCDLDGGFTTDANDRVTRHDDDVLRSAMRAEAERFLAVEVDTQLALLRSQVDGPIA